MKHTYKNKKGCNDCQKVKPISEFGERAGKQKGMLTAYCKQCMGERQVAWRKKNRVAYNLYQLKYRRKHLCKN